VERGYTGSRALLSNALQAWRPPRAARRKQYRRLTRRQIKWLCQRRPETLDPEERVLLQRLLNGDPTLAKAHALRQRFHTVITGGEIAALHQWIADALASNLLAFVALANGLQADRVAVDAAITTRWSTGPVEGHVHKVKLRKRRGSGRAGFAFLRQRDQVA